MPKNNHKFTDSQTNKYYLEGSSLQNTPRFKRVIFGRLADIMHEKANKDLIKKGNKSCYCGWLFQTVHHNDHWTIKKDEAFYAGAISAKKIFHLVTNINYCINAEVEKFNKYMEKNGHIFILNPDALMQRPHRIGVTFREILWMIDNHYTYRISQKNPFETVFEPSTQTPDEAVINNYNPSYWKPFDWQTHVIDRLREIQKNINEAREALNKDPESGQMLKKPYISL